MQAEVACWKVKTHNVQGAAWLHTAPPVKQGQLSWGSAEASCRKTPKRARADCWKELCDELKDSTSVVGL